MNNRLKIFIIPGIVLLLIFVFSPQIAAYFITTKTSEPLVIKMGNVDLKLDVALDDKNTNCGVPGEKSCITKRNRVKSNIKGTPAIYKISYTLTGNLDGISKMTIENLPDGIMIDKSLSSNYEIVIYGSLDGTSTEYNNLGDIYLEYVKPQGSSGGTYALEVQMMAVGKNASSMQEVFGLDPNGEFKSLLY